MTFRQPLEYIAALEPRGWRLGLDRMQEFVRRAGLEDALGGEDGPNFIHIAGTNGKGSVTAYLQSILTDAGFRTGAFFSPYVVDPRERVQFGREMISKEDFVAITEELVPVAESFGETGLGGITEFEFKTALGFAFWKRMRCEWVALEVGLGGRLDATNVVMPKASVIVSIGHDHMNILGHTLEEIAFEKAGVIKPGVPVIVGQMAPEALSVIEQVAAQQDSPCWRFGREVNLVHSTVTTPVGEHSGLTPGLTGASQPHNMAMAVAALDAAQIAVEDEHVRTGVSGAFAPGRFQVVTWKNRKLILDGAHNPEAAQSLKRSLDQHFRGLPTRVSLVTNMIAGHEPEEFYRELAPWVQAAHVVPIEFHRALPVCATAASLNRVVERVTQHESIADGLKSALEDEVPILVTGSFYLVGEVARLEGITHV